MVYWFPSAILYDLFDSTVVLTNCFEQINSVT